jgi:type I restriction enzyme, S subunit
MSVENKLPEGWVECAISDVSIKGEQRKPDDHENFIYVDIGSINRDTKCIENPQSLLGSDAPSRARKVIQTGDILVSLTRPNLNAVALVPEEYDEQIASTGFEVIKPLITDSRIIFALTKTKYFIDEISGAVQGALYPAAKSSDVQTVRFPLPPLAEQQVIADQLDSLLAQVEATRTRLERIPDTLKRFRQSVLADAVSGRLTEEWRSQHKLDSVSDLSSELVLNDGKAKKVESTSGHELMTEIFPPSWEVSTFNLLYRFIDYRGKTPKKSDSGKRLYSAKNIKMGWLSDEPIEYLDESDYTAWMTRGFTNLGDIFFVTEGHTMGCVAINDIGSDIALAQRTLTLQPYGKINTKFHFYYMLTAEFQRLVELNATGSAAKGIKSAKFRGLPAPFPSFKEQNQIVRRVEQLFAYADRVEQQANAALVQVSQLTRSILAKAFRGELTAKWRAANPELVSGDNSAGALLARIKEERAAVVRSGRKIKAEV